jgi:hypothetical protein
MVDVGMVYFDCKNIHKFDFVNVVEVIMKMRGC